MLNGRQLDKIDQELIIKVSNPKKEEADGILVVKISMQRTLVFSREASSKIPPYGNIQSDQDQLMVV